MKIFHSSASRRLHALIDTQAAVELDLQGYIIDANPPFLSAMGYLLEDIKGAHQRLFIDPDYAQSSAYFDVWDALRRGESQVVECIHINRQREQLWMQSSYHPITNRLGQVSSVILVVQDFTQRKLLSTTFENQFKAISQSQAVIEFDIHGAILNANDNFLAIIGYSLQELQGKHDRILIDQPEANSAGYRQLWSNLRAGQYQMGEFRRRHKSGRDIWFQASYNPIPDTQGRPRSVIVLATDITAMVNQRTHDALLSQVTYGTDQAIIITNIDGEIEYVNHAFEKLTGYRLDEILGEKPGQLLQGPLTDANTVQHMHFCIKRRQAFQVEIVNYTKQGESYWTALTVNPVLDQQGVLQRFVCVQTNITQSKLKALEDATRLKSIRATTPTAEWSARGELLDANTQMLQILEQSGTTTAKKMLESIYCDVMNSMSAQQLQQGIGCEFEFSVNIANGQEKWLKGTLNPLMNNIGNLVGVTMYAIDITAQHQTMAQIRSAVESINGLAMQTSVLAMRATIEAAKAGENGRGFAQVASAARQLAHDSADSASEIAALLQSP